jgi:hypothetical protein
MRVILTLLIVFGSVTVIYIVHWSRRAASAVDDASKIYRETSSITETAKQLYREQIVPDAVRLSRRQIQFVESNFDDFERLYGPAINAATNDALKRWRERQGEQSCSPTEADNMMRNFIHIISMRHAKVYCSEKGIF